MSSWFQKLFRPAAKPSNAMAQSDDRRPVEDGKSMDREPRVTASARSNADEGIFSCAERHVIIGNIGTTYQGKSTLIRAMAARAKILSGQTNPSCTGPFQNLLNAKKLIGPGYALCAYQSASRHCLHIDPDSNDNVFSLLFGGIPLDVVLAVISAADGPMPGLREMLTLARVNCPPGVYAKLSGGRMVVGSYNDGPLHECKLLIFLNKTDVVDDKDLLGLVRVEVSELAKRSFWHPNDTTIIYGSADLALRNPDDPVDSKCIDEVLEVIATCETAAERTLRG